MVADAGAGGSWPATRWPRSGADPATTARRRAAAAAALPAGRDRPGLLRRRGQLADQPDAARRCCAGWTCSAGDSMAATLRSAGHRGAAGPGLRRQGSRAPRSCGPVSGCGTTLIPSPAAAIKLTRHNLSYPTAILHETGHQVAHLTGWTVELADAPGTTRWRRDPPTSPRLWRSWAGEVAADVHAFALAGWAPVVALANCGRRHDGRGVPDPVRRPAPVRLDPGAVQRRAVPQLVRRRAVGRRGAGLVAAAPIRARADADASGPGRKGQHRRARRPRRGVHPAADERLPRRGRWPPLDRPARGGSGPVLEDLHGRPAAPCSPRHTCAAATRCQPVRAADHPRGRRSDQRRRAPRPSCGPGCATSAPTRPA